MLNLRMAREDKVEKVRGEDVVALPGLPRTHRWDRGCAVGEPATGRRFEDDDFRALTGARGEPRADRYVIESPSLATKVREVLSADQWHRPGGSVTLSLIRLTWITSTTPLAGNNWSRDLLTREAPVGIEPTNSRFAVCRLTTWPRRRTPKVIARPPFAQPAHPGAPLDTMNAQ